MEDEWTTAAERKEWPVFVLEAYDIVAVPAPTIDRSPTYTEVGIHV